MEGKVQYSEKYDEFCRMSEDMLPPPELYRFQPPEHVVFRGTDRMLFEGEQLYTKDEKHYLQELFKYFKTNKIVIKDIYLPMALRFIYAYKFAIPDSANAIVDFYQWYNTEVPIPMNDNILKCLQCGFLYVTGRDIYYRPTLVVFPMRAVLDPSLMDSFESACIVFVEYMLQYMLVPGKVENWVTILNLEGAGLTKIPYGPLKKMINTFQRVYRARLAKMVIVNASFFIRSLWTIVETFLDENTRSKIQIFNTNKPDILKELICEDQLLEIFGGKAPMPERSWPPCFPKGKIRKDTTTDHLTDDKLIPLLKKESRMIPPPELAYVSKEAWKGKIKKGPVPKKTLYLTNRIERRDSFNEIIEEPRRVIQKPISEAPQVAISPSIHQDGEPLQTKEKEPSLMKKETIIEKPEAEPSATNNQRENLAQPDPMLATSVQPSSDLPGQKSLSEGDIQIELESNPEESQAKKEAVKTEKNPQVESEAQTKNPNIISTPEQNAIVEHSPAKPKPAPPKAQNGGCCCILF